MKTFLLKKRLLIVAASLFVVAPIKLFGWGGGHDHVNRLALTVMPPEIKSFLGKENAEKFVKWSHSPDDFTPWAELKHVTICAEDMDVLKNRDMKHPYSLHSHKGHAINFILLIKAFQARDPERAAFWMSCLMHTVADELACNHDPLIHFMTYGFKDYGLEMGNGIGVDFADAAGTQEGDKVIQSILKDVEVVPVAVDPQNALLKVMMSGIEGNAYMTARGSRIAASYAHGASDDVRRESIRAMAELGVQGIRESLNVILTAWNFAQRNRLPVLNGEVEKKYNLAKKTFVLQRLLRKDSLFTELLDATTEKKPYIGVLVEPSVSMNKAKLGFSSKFISAAIVRTLRYQNKVCRFVDIREVEKNGFPSVSEMPLLAVSAGGFHVSKEVATKLAAYTESGGKLLWIGGDHKDQLGPLSKNMLRADSKLMPVSNKYGKDSPALKKAVIVFRSVFEKSLGGREYKFVHNPNTKAGWQKPICNYYIKAGSDSIIPLAEMTVDQNVMTIAAACKNVDGVAQYVFLPEYLVSPYLLSDETAIKDPSQPVLDSVGTKILMASVKVLMKKGVTFPNSVRLTAHRGASYDAPENTLAAFNMAWEQGADGIEGDFYLTSDGHVVCIHDSTTKRTGDTNLTVSASTLAELRAVDVGSWKGEQWQGAKIPTLQEVIATIPKGKYIHVEIKVGVEIVEPIAEILEESSLTSDQIIIICFNKKVVAAAKKRLPDCRVLWLTSIKDEGPSAEQVLDVLKSTGADGVGTSANAKVVDEEYVRTVQDNGKYKFNVWTLNSGGLASQFAATGLEAISTDRPAYLRFCLRDVPLADPVIHWAFDKSPSNCGTGGAVYDSVFHNSPGYTEGKAGSNALALDGVDDYVSVAYTLPDQGSIALRYYAKPWYNYQSIFDNSVDENDWEMWIDEKGILWSRIESGKGQVGCDLNKLEGSNHWYHIVFAWDRANDITSLYVNGKERSSSGIKEGWVKPGEMFYLGGGNKGNTPGNGIFDDVRIYDMMLTPKNVLKLYKEK